MCTDRGIYTVKCPTTPHALTRNTTNQVTKSITTLLGCLTAQDVHMLTFIMKAAPAEWKTIGDALGFLDSDLTLIQRSPMLTLIQRSPMLIPEGPISYFREMLSQWLKWALPNHPWPTLEALRNTFQSSGQESLALQLRLQKEGKSSGCF